MSLWEILGIEDPKKRPGATPDPNKGDYRDIKPAHTQVRAHGRDFVDNAAVRQYEAQNGLTKDCPDCLNNPIRRCNCSTCGNTGKVPLNYGVF